MSADGSITLIWGDGENKFRFAIGQFRELQEKINTRRVAIGAPVVGPMTVLAALRTNDAWPDDVRDVLRIGLVGAGMSTQEAHRKLVMYFDGRPLLENVLAASAVLLAGLVGDPTDEEDLKKKKETPSEQFHSEPSTEPALH
jgi:hypothetical protein